MLTLLQGMGPSDQEFDIVHLQHLVNWMRGSMSSSRLEINRRFGFLLDALAADQALCGRVKVYLEQFLQEARYRYTFAELGILGNDTFGQAIKKRIFLRMLPVTIEDKTIQESINVLFHQETDHEWLSTIALDSWVQLFELLGWVNRELPIWQRIQHEMLEAMEMLAVRIAALGIESEVVRCLAFPEKHISPFVEQHLELRRVIEEAHEKLSLNGDLSDMGAHLDVLFDQCIQQIKKVHAQAKVLGISVSLSLTLIRIEQSIGRMRLMLQLMGALPTPSRVESCVRFFQTLVREENRKHSLADLWSGLTEKMALRITEHASKTGERYATETRSEYWGMARAAMGAGIIIAFLSIIKAGISSLQLAPFWQAVAFSLNYGIGFVLIHILKFTIATKQPAMTAARIAAAIDSNHGRLGSLDRVVELIVQVARTQFVAILGNIIPAFLTACAVATLWTFTFGEPPINLVKSEKMLFELNPFFSAALPHAAIAGVFLFLAGVISGYYDNLSIYYRIPQRLRKVVWLRKLLGVVRLNRFAEYLTKNTGALAGNFFFGCMLGSAGFVGLIFGLPIDIRHITFAAANMAYGLQAQGFDFSVHEIAVAGLGVLLIGCVNLAVSFSLAFFTALKARGVQIKRSTSIGRLLLVRLRHTPLSFFYPPKLALADSKKEAEKSA